MKKYIKPDIFFESFQLTQHIAACGWDLHNMGTVETCVSYGDEQDVYIDNDFIAASGPVFVESNASCRVKTEAYCYTPPSDDMLAVFASI